MSSKSVLPFIGLGLFLIAIDAASVLVGSVPVRYGRGIRLDEQPEFFWAVVAIYLVSGLILISLGVWRYLRR